jgi:PadR family transcriptional regulator PadR
MNTDTTFSPLRKGLLELAVLTIISKHQVYVADILATLARTEFKSGEGTLYPLLSKLKRDGLLDYRWVESANGPPRKYYLLTGEGQQRLSDLQAYIATLNETLATLGGQDANSHDS